MASNEFMIRHPETGAEFGLHSVDVFTERYQPMGFVVPAEQPHGWIAPDVVTGWGSPVLTADHRDRAGNAVDLTTAADPANKRRVKVPPKSEE